MSKSKEKRPSGGHVPSSPPPPSSPGPLEPPPAARAADPGGLADWAVRLLCGTQDGTVRQQHGGPPVIVTVPQARYVRNPDQSCTFYDADGGIVFDAPPGMVASVRRHRAPTQENALAGGSPGIVHLAPPQGSNVLPCCGKPAGANSLVTAARPQVTCEGAEDGAGHE